MHAHSYTQHAAATSREYLRCSVSTYTAHCLAGSVEKPPGSFRGQARGKVDDDAPHGGVQQGERQPEQGGAEDVGPGRQPLVVALLVPPGQPLLLHPTASLSRACPQGSRLGRNRWTLPSEEESCIGRRKGAGAYRQLHLDGAVKHQLHQREEHHCM